MELKRGIASLAGLTLGAMSCSPAPSADGSAAEVPVAAGRLRPQAVVPAVCEGKTFVGEILDGRGRGEPLTVEGRRYLYVQTVGGPLALYGVAIRRGHTGDSFDLATENAFATFYYEANNECAVNINLSLRIDQTSQGDATIFRQSDTITESNVGTYRYRSTRDPDNSWVRIRWAIRNAAPAMAPASVDDGIMQLSSSFPTIPDCGATSAGAPPTGPDGEACDSDDEYCYTPEDEVETEGPTCE